MMLVHAFWIYEKTSGLSKPTKAGVIAVTVTAVISLGWSPVAAEYHREHFVVNGKRFIEALRVQATDRYAIKIGCAPGSEEECVIAGHFLAARGKTSRAM
jgi:hypothetical protein